MREPVQVYLDPPDRSLLDALVESTGLSKAELAELQGLLLFRRGATLARAVTHFQAAGFTLLG